MSRHGVIVAAIAAIAILSAPGCADRRAASTFPEPGPPVTVPEEKIGLAAGRLEELPPLAAVPAAPGDPGDSPLQPAVYSGAPPGIPHSVDDFLPIGRDENLCLDCHGVEEKVEGEPTPVPASHYEDLRNAPGARGDDVVGARWACLACHVAPTDAAPLVGNDF